MRIALLIVLALAACGKKKSPQAPAESQQMKQDADEKDESAPAQGEDRTETRSSDPQEGGE